MLSSSKTITGKFTEDERELSQLIVNISRGEEESLEILYDRTSSLVFGLVLKILSNRQEAEEVLADVFLQIWDKAATYDPSRSKPASWILMISRSRSIDKLRSGSKRRSLTEQIDNTTPDSKNDPEENSIAYEKRSMIQNAMKELSDNQKEAIELAYYFGMSQSEIAKEMDQPLGTVKSWIRFGMMKLREHLKKV